MIRDVIFKVELVYISSTNSALSVAFPTFEDWLQMLGIRSGVFYSLEFCLALALSLNVMLQWQKYSVD